MAQNGAGRRLDAPEKLRHRLLYEQADDWDEALSLIDLRNQIDSALFTQFTCGADNFLTNRMYAQFEPDGPLYRVPWDLNYSLGDASSSYDWLNLRRTPAAGPRDRHPLAAEPGGNDPAAGPALERASRKPVHPRTRGGAAAENAELLHRSGAYEREYSLWVKNDGVVAHVSNSGGKPSCAAP